MESVAMAARNAIKTHSGRYYRVGSISSITKRIIAGSVVDYAYGVVKIPLALVMELPSNEYGFQPPVEKISPLSAESWCGIREMCKHAYELKAQIDKEEQQPIQLLTENGVETNDTEPTMQLEMLKEEAMSIRSKNHKNPEEIAERPSCSELVEDAKSVIRPKFIVRGDSTTNAISPRTASRDYFSSLLDFELEM